MWYMWCFNDQVKDGWTREQAIQRFRDKYHQEPVECNRVRHYWHVGPVPEHWECDYSTRTQ